MADTKKVDVKKVAEEAKKATETVKVTAEKAASSVRATAEKSAKAAEKATEKAAETAKKASATAKKTATTAKKTATKRTTKKKVEVTRTAVLQFAGEDFKIDEIIANAEAAFKAENKRKAVHDIKVYIKPEERAAYYVVTSGESEYAGKIGL